ncbi:lysophospholipid acyltransferase family protein [Methylocystis heyeri]|uniref:1-acyl-sn-glycerol-3-phosphate acyltransferase n=1 Tax=Methylocystis heyeri TaxID=391905 RepID=A0A6B8KEK4_9HYPH|nr:lysophospholipid acyltransferase family protein [Methylocystis heyeri]QGM45445.1 1-acyl-sn-glycerol-3-phosphate acyltransferase [Methylocystis heyeri]
MKPLAARAARRLIAGFARAVTGVSADWRGCRPEPQQRVYFANHASHGDFVLIWTVLPPELRRITRPVAAAELWDRPGIGGFIGREVFRAVPIDRDAHRAGAAMAAMSTALNEGASLILFPEGTRNTGEEPLLPLRSGLFHLAKAFPHIDFVPVWIDNISRVMPKGEFLPIPLLCSVTFGEPLAIDPAEERSAFLERARGALLALKPEALVE